MSADVWRRSTNDNKRARSDRQERKGMDGGQEERGKSQCQREAPGRKEGESRQFGGFGAEFRFRFRGNLNALTREVD